VIGPVVGRGSPERASGRDSPGLDGGAPRIVLKLCGQRASYARADALTGTRVCGRVCRRALVDVWVDLRASATADRVSQPGRMLISEHLRISDPMLIDR
jgi:hypothetical protein